MTVSLILLAVVAANLVLGTATSIASPQRVIVKRQLNQPWNQIVFNSHERHHHHHQNFERRCVYWCQTSVNSYYCCDTGFPGSNPWPIIQGGNKPGSCPPRNPFCTQWSDRSWPCTDDQQCRWTLKCCFDTCLNYNTCKRPNLIPFIF